MKKEKKKKCRVFFTMNSDLYDKFQNHIEENLLDQSKLLEKLIEDYIKNQKNE